MSSKKLDERDELKKKTAQKDIEIENVEEPEEISDSAAPEEAPEQKSKPDKDPEEDQRTQYLRLMADYQNFKKRTEKEKSDIYAFANEKIVRELLEVIDNFERAMDHTAESSDRNLVNGMTAIFKQLKGVLEKNGIAELIADNQEFDPSLHHAVSTENTEDFQSGHVVETLQKGYTLKGKVIRPAMVKVAE